jgi:hypothetical protein
MPTSPGGRRFSFSILSGSFDEAGNPSSKRGRLSLTLPNTKGASLGRAAGSGGCWLTVGAAPNTNPPVRPFPNLTLPPPPSPPIPSCLEPSAPPPPPPPPNGFHVPAGACGGREREEAGGWRRFARRGARREGGGALAKGSAPGGARPSPRPGFAMWAAAASSGPLGFWRGGSGATAGGIPAAAGQRPAAAGALWKGWGNGGRGGWGGRSAGRACLSD